MQPGKSKITSLLFGLLVGNVVRAAEPPAADTLAKGFQSPPVEARLHAYWWWLNGNVTTEAITRNLEAMKEKGFGGALITDAGGADKDGNLPVPGGPLFASEPWRRLYRHALREGKRLNLEMALMIQSGWNLGGPGVTPDDAAKMLCWSETPITGPGPVTKTLPAPRSRHGLLREVAVLAVPDGSGDQDVCKVTASSAHKGYPPALAGDGNMGTWWVSDGTELPDGELAWIRLAFDRDRQVSELMLSGRPGYGPKSFAVFAIGPNGERRKLTDGSTARDGVGRLKLDPASAVRGLEIRVTDGHDPHPVGGRPRNVQIAELRVVGPGWQWPSFSRESLARWEEKTLLRPVGGANHDTSFLVPGRLAEAGSSLDPHRIVNLTPVTDADGRLQWNVPIGT